MNLTRKDDEILSHDHPKCVNNLLHVNKNKENCSVSWRTELGRIHTEESIIRELLIKKDQWYIISENGPEIPARKVIVIKQS